MGNRFEHLRKPFDGVPFANKQHRLIFAGKMAPPKVHI